MSAPVKVVVHGLADPAQAGEAAAFGIDGAIVALGPGPMPAIEPELAAAVAAQLPPLAARLALLPPGTAVLPRGFSGAVTSLRDDRPAGALVHVACAPADEADPELIPADVDGVWLAPRGGAPSATAYDWDAVARLARRFHVLLEAPDGPDGVETLVRLGRPHAVVLGAGVWFAPGIIDMDRLEEAAATVARLNKGALLR